MHIGMVGLGRMGANMRDRLRAAGHDVVGYDTDISRSDVSSLADLIAALVARRLLWVMVPAGDITRATIRELAGLAASGDLVIDRSEERRVGKECRCRRRTSPYKE